MGWRLTVAKQAILTRLPFGQGLRSLKRRLVGYEPNIGNLESTLSQYEEMKRALAEVGRPIDGAVILEIGSGWFPTIPIMLAVDGAKHVFMSDLTPHMDERTIAATLRFLREAYPDNPALAKVKGISDLPISYLVPFEEGMVADGSLDLVISRTVLEHIPPDDLARLLARLRRKLSSEGRMFHLIDHSDHLEHSDKSISKINFLTWTERQHRFVNWLLKSGENRLRYHEFPAIFADAGYSVVATSREIHHPTREIAKALPLAPPYSTMSADELAVVTSTYILSPRS